MHIPSSGNVETQPQVRALQSLSDLRRATGKGQKAVADALNIKQPSVSKIERQADIHMSTLRDYVEAIGGELSIVVRLPEFEAVELSVSALTTTTKSKTHHKKPQHRRVGSS